MKVQEQEIQIHLGCYSYGKNMQYPFIEVNHYEKNVTQEIFTKSNQIFVVQSGAIKFSYGRTRNKKAVEGSIFILPEKNKCEIITTKPTTLISFRLDFNLSFCDHFSFEMLNKEKKMRKQDAYILESNEVIFTYLQFLVAVINDGLYCNYLMNLKTKELLYYLRYYYPKQELQSFFYPILNDDFEFTSIIRKYYTPDITLCNLAKKSNYSVSGFEKRFKKVFGLSPSHWLLILKSQAVYHEINCSNKTFTELGYEFGFSSPSHFNNFCKKIFKCAPGAIRKLNSNK
jgi:AraC-like DNA-binding protein